MPPRKAPQAKPTSTASKSTSGPATRGRTSATAVAAPGAPPTVANPTKSKASIAAEAKKLEARKKAEAKKSEALKKAEAKKLEALKKAEREEALRIAEAQKKETRKRTAAMLAKECGDFEDQEDEEGEEDESMDLPRPRKSRKVTDSSDEEADAPAEDALEEDEADPSCAKDVLHLDSSEDEAPPPAGDDLEDLEGTLPTPSLQQDHEIVFKSTDTMTIADTTASKGATKVILNDFNSPRAIRIAKIALRGMRRDTALQEGFPPSGRWISLSWTIMCREAFPDKELKAKMEEAQGDEDLKAKLVAYTWNGSCQVRGTLVGKARSGVPVWYKLSALQGNELKEAVDWLLEDDAFLHDGIDIEARTYDKSRIWMNPALACLMEDSFWSAKGDAVRMGKKGNAYLELPDPLLSISATAIKCAFKGIRDTCSMKGIVHFTDAAYGPEWRHYMELLEKFKNDSPTYYDLIKLELQDMLRERSKDVASFLDNEASIANTKIDFNAMEEAGKAAMAARKSK